MKPDTQLDLIRETRDAYWQPPCTLTPAEWCQRHVTFDEPDNHGSFSLAQREYIIDPLNTFADPTVTDCAIVSGSQVGKTALLMGGVAWMMKNQPTRVLWVMPSIDLARKFSETRWCPMVRASSGTRDLVPADRHQFKNLQQRIGAGLVDFFGSNSPANLASTPCRVVILDEVDKFSEGTDAEADAVNLAEQRTKKFSNPKRFKVSTPTIEQGLIWQEAMKGDLRRYYLPCPHCGKFVTLGWSKKFSVLWHTGDEAWIEWDKEARRKAGWDLDRVEKSAHAVCPHCQGHILDGQKTAMVRRGEWRPTRACSGSFRSFQISSLYAASRETTFGKLAVKFLTQKSSLLGLQGFINGDLAEPYSLQDRQSERLEMVSAQRDTTGDNWKTLMTVDCQAKSPHFWYVVRSWSDGDTVGKAAGSADTWEELRDIQARHDIPDICVCVDSGWGARSDADVYEACARHSLAVPSPKSGRSVLLGWMPAKGLPGRKRWRVKDSNVMLPYFVRGVDPFDGTTRAGETELSLIEFSGDFFKDILESLRKPDAKIKWTVSQDAATEEYWRHLNSEIKAAVVNPTTGRAHFVWKLRSQHWPNHMGDCEVMQVVMAVYFGLLQLDA